MSAATHSFTISTWADSRSNRRDRTYKVTAAHAEDAVYEARMLAMRTVRQNVTICTSIIDVDGRGKPKDCPHDEKRLWGGFTVRSDGGRDCPGCVLGGVTL